MKAITTTLVIFLALQQTPVLAAEGDIESDTPVTVVESYFRHLRSGDIGSLLGLLDDNIVWHQPGQNRLSKTYYGKDQVSELFQNFMNISQGSFRIDDVSAIMGNGDWVVANLHFSASRCQYFAISMSMKGSDLMKVVNGKIVEVRLFSEDQAAEDRFWGAEIEQ